jgi:hypothetical protein
VVGWHPAMAEMHRPSRTVGMFPHPRTRAVPSTTREVHVEETVASIPAVAAGARPASLMVIAARPEPDATLCNGLVLGFGLVLELGF